MIYKSVTEVNIIISLTKHCQFNSHSFDYINIMIQFVEITIIIINLQLIPTVEENQLISASLLKIKILFIIN